MPPFPEVWERLAGLQQLRLGNPSSAHQEGRTARGLLEQARAQVAALVGAASEEVVFTSGGTEANAMALWGLTLALGGPAGVTVYVCAVEHPSVFAAAQSLERLGARVEVFPVDWQGRAQLAGLAPRPPAVVCLQLANHETGVLQPVEVLVTQVRQPQVLVHCDAVQAAGKLGVDFHRLGVDTLALSGHKLGGLPGVGALVVRQGLELPALVAGEQEQRRRGGTEPLVAACAMGWACEVLASRKQRWEQVAQLRDELEEQLLAKGLAEEVFSRLAPRVPNTTCFALPPPLLGQVAVAALDLAQVAVSSGPACSSGASRESAVVRAMGFGEMASRALRVSMGLATTPEEVACLLTALERLVHRGAKG